MVNSSKELRYDIAIDTKKGNRKVLRNFSFGGFSGFFGLQRNLKSEMFGGFSGVQIPEKPPTKHSIILHTFLLNELSEAISLS